MSLRDAALISLAYDAGLRVSELVALRVADLRQVSDGSGRLTIAFSKTDQDGEGALAWLSSETMQRLSAWLLASRIADARVLKQLAHQSQCGPRVSSLLPQHVEDFTFVIDSAPKIHSCPANADNHFIEMPTRRWVRSCAAKRPREASAKREHPAADRFVTDFDATLSEQILDIPEAHRKAEIEPDRMSNHARWKAVTVVTDRLHRGRVTFSSYGRRDLKSEATVNLTTPI